MPTVGVLQLIKAVIIFIITWIYPLYCPEGPCQNLGLTGLCFFIDSQKIQIMFQRDKDLCLKEVIKLLLPQKTALVTSTQVCPAGSRVLPDLEEEILPAFEINILLLVSCFLILHYMDSMILIKKETRRVCTCYQKSARKGFLAKIFKAAWKDFLLTSVL